MNRFYQIFVDKSNAIRYNKRTNNPGVGRGKVDGRMEIGNFIVLITLFGSLLALCYALLMARRVKKFPEGTERMQKISASIRTGQTPT